MNALQMYRQVLLLFPICVPVLARGQAVSAPSDKSQERIQSHTNKTAVVDSLKKDQSADQFRRKVAPTQAADKPSIHRIQMPKRTQPTWPILVFFSGALGAVLFMSLFTITQFLLNRDAPYGWYAVCLSIVSIWLWQSTRIWFNGDLVPQNMTVFFALMMLLGYGMLMSYVHFVSYLLEVSQQPRLERLKRYFLYFAGVSLLVLLAESFIWPSSILYILINLLTYCGLLFLMVMMLRRAHPLKRYALAGSLFLVSGAIVTTCMNNIGSETTDQLLRMPLFYLVVSQLLEILCFSLALGRRFFLNKEEKIQVQHQLIQQLEANQQLQQTHTLELEHQLAQRTTEVLTQAHELEEQRIHQLRTGFEHRAAEAEMAGLRSQMSPHFIFNCLNSIKLYAIENDSEKASDYLTKFLRLIRMVLENSRFERVSLQNELETLRLYMDMEAMRFKQKLSFRIDVAPDVDARFLEMPPLLIQPYVVNAIWHGLMHKPTGVTVHVQATLLQETML